jgi:hypothetical protein
VAVAGIEAVEELVYFPTCVVVAKKVRDLGVDHVHAPFSNHPAIPRRVVHRLTGAERSPA